MKFSMLVLSASMLLPAWTARADQPAPAPAAATAPAIKAEPVIEPEEEPALVAAKQTLSRAHAHLEVHAAGEPRPPGFGKQTVLEPLRTRHEIMISKNDGTLVGYALEVAASSKADAKWTPVAVNPEGHIQQTLFAGPEAVFAKITNVSPETLAKAGRADVRSTHPIDLHAAKMAEKQRAARTAALPARR